MAFWSNATSKNGVVWGQEFNCYDVHELLTTQKTFLWTKHEDVVRVVWDIWTEIVCGNVIHWSSFWRTYQKIYHMYLSSDGKVQM